MSIAKGFENKLRMANGKRAWYFVRDVDKLLAYTRALEAMLKKHEFIGNVFGHVVCPECEGDMDNDETPAGHFSDCQLYKLLDGIE